MHSHIDIEVAGHSMTVPQDQSIDIEESNPMFNDIEMMSYPAQLPFNKNRGVFKNLDDRDSDLRAQDVEGQVSRIIVGGLPFRTTVMHVQENEVLKDSISVNFDSRKKSFKDMISDLKCREVPVKDDILIGEKIGTIDVSFRYRPKLNIWYTVPETASGAGVQQTARFGDYDTKEATFTPPVLGFSYPGICNRTSTIAPAVIKETLTYAHPSMEVNIPVVAESFINVSKPYPQAKYCNSRICYAHHEYDSEKEDTSDDIVPADSEQSNGPQDFGPYWVLDADRPASGICFYVGYFLECLFNHLGVAYDMSVLTDIEDFNYMAFFTTACKCDERPVQSFGINGDLIPAIGNINEWLSSRGCGGQIKFDTQGTEKSTNVKQYTINGKTYTVGNIFDESTFPGTSVITSMRIAVEYEDFSAKARVRHMYANSENFPDATVTEVIESLENSFGCRFAYDPEINKVTVYLLRDVFRSQTAPIHLNAKVNTMYKMTEKISGIRMKYSGESDPDEQRENVRYGKKDYDTDYDYIEYPENRTNIKRYRDVVQKIDATDMNVYVDPTTGNAIRIKIDKDYTSVRDMKPVAFEVGQFKGIEIGDCSDDNEDYIKEFTSSFQPIVVNDVNYGNGGFTDPLYQPVLVPYIDEDMEREFIETKLQNPFTVENNEIYFTYVLRMAESYDPSGSDDGLSPLMSHDWGLAIGILRTGDGGAGVENYDPDYDGFGNWRWRDIADNYCMSSDTMDQTGLWLGKTDHGNTFSLKIRAWKPFLYYIDGDGKTHITSDMSLEGQAVGVDNYTWLLPCANDVRDASGKITERYRSRGLADTFMAEFFHFLLNRHKYKITALVEIAQLADIPNHWRNRYEIDGKVGYIDKLHYSIDAQKGIGEVEIDFYSI